MNLREAWDATEHGKGLLRPNGNRLEKWADDLDRYVEKNKSTIPLDDLMAQDWMPE